MGTDKERIEPEVSMTGTASTEPVPEMPGEPSEVTLEELIPGLDEAIADAEGDVDPLEERIEELEAELADMRDKWARALAEGENVRRRAERDRKDAAAYGGTKLARDLLSVYDNLDRALKAADEETRAAAASFIEGVELTQRELVNAFAKHKIEKVTPAPGEKFDPNKHQAMFEAPIPGAPNGPIIEVMQAGFTIADRLLRPALVGVAKAPPEPAPEPEAAPEETSEDGNA